MLIKLGIIAAVSVGVLMAFSSEINEYFPNTVTTGLESFKADLGYIASKSIQSAEERIDSSSQELATQLESVTGTTLDSATQTLEDQLTELKDTSAEFVEENITEKLDVQSLPGL